MSVSAFWQGVSVSDGGDGVSGPLTANDLSAFSQPQNLLCQDSASSHLSTDHADACGGERVLRR